MYEFHLVNIDKYYQWKHCYISFEEERKYYLLTQNDEQSFPRLDAYTSLPYHFSG